MSDQPEGSVQVLVEMLVPRNQTTAAALETAAPLNKTGFKVDSGYEPVPSSPADAEKAIELDQKNQQLVLVRGKINEEKIDQLKAQPEVVHVWPDTNIAPF